MFLSELVIGAIFIGLTVIIHAVALDRLIVLLENAGPWVFKKFHKLWKIPMLIIAVLGTFASNIVQIWIWAILYMGIGEMQTLEEALYFSTTTYTTVGYGDVVLSEDWRLISSFQSANGFIIFGWSTAFIFEIMSRLYKNEQIRKTEKS